MKARFTVITEHLTDDGRRVGKAYRGSLTVPTEESGPATRDMSALFAAMATLREIERTMNQAAPGTPTTLDGPRETTD